MERHTESWQLRSGTWHHDAKSGAWRLACTPNGTVTNPKLSSDDIGRMVGARRDATSGEWLPSDFSYSPHDGRLLHASITTLGSPWVPPFGASGLASDLDRNAVKGLRQTPASLTLARSRPRFDRSTSDTRTLPALPPGQHRFLVHKFDVVSPTLIAIEPERAEILVLLPESNAWVPLEHPPAGPLAGGLENSRGWRLEVLEEAGFATAYFPTVKGLAAVTPTLIGVSYTVEYFGEAAALGGPVAWAGKVWLPVLGSGGVELLGKPRDAGKPTVLATTARIPRNGFEAPVADLMAVNWPSQEGQLIVRMDPRGQLETEWIAWPEGLWPVFSSGSPYLSRSGSFWQLCRRGDDSLEYVMMGRAEPETAAVDTPRLGTGHVSYLNDQRLDIDPWSKPTSVSSGTSSEVVVPIVESELDRSVVGLRINAPHGALALFDSEDEHETVLQLQAADRPALAFGTLKVTRPWLTSLFVYDSHLWAYHPELSQARGWKLDIEAMPG